MRASLDIGAGPGFLAAEMAAVVEPGGRVFAVDPSESMRELARSRGAALEIRSGSAEALPLPDDAVDVAVATQVLEYVPDVHEALAEIRRVLRPGGRLLVLDTDWDSIVWHSSDPERMRAVLAAWEEHLADPWLPRTLGPALRDAGFDVGPPTTFALLNTGTARGTFSAGLIPLIADFVVGRRRPRRGNGESLARGPRRPRGSHLLQPQPLPVLRARAELNRSPYGRQHGLDVPHPRVVVDSGQLDNLAPGMCAAR